MSKFEKAARAVAHQEKQRNFAEQAGDKLGVIRSILTLVGFKQRIKQEEFNSSKNQTQ